MSHSYPALFSYPALLLLALSACDQNGGAMPLNGQNFLSSLDGPKITSRKDTQIEAAQDAEKNNDFAQASQIYQQILEQDPDTTSVIQLLADSLRRNGEYDKAINVYDGLLAKNSADLSAKEGKALALLAKGDFETPTGLFEEVLKEDANRWKALNGMGILFVTRGLYPDSLQYFEEALNQSPNNTSIMNNLGLSLALNRQYEPAIDMLFKASGRSTMGSFGRKRIELNLALVYASAGNLNEAEKIAKAHLNGPELNNNLGLYAHLAKDDGLAKSYLNMALTESKTYYGKAWDNLEVLSNNDGNNNSNHQNSKTIELENKEKIFNKATEPKEKSKKKSSSNQKQSQKITLTREPNATKSEVESLGNIIVHEINKNDKIPATAKNEPSIKAKPDSIEDSESPLIVMPNVINSEEKRITVDSVIDDLAKAAAKKTKN
jgi:Flp pilus assembly protein TadD